MLRREQATLPNPETTKPELIIPGGELKVLPVGISQPSSGTHNSNRAPLPFVDDAKRAVPLASCIRFLTMASPRPVPLCLVVKKGSQIRWRNSGGIPAPPSSTAITSCPSSLFSVMEIVPPIGRAHV